MIWLIGNKGMLGSDIESLLKSEKLDYIVSDIETDITDIAGLESFVKGKNINRIINCSAYTAVDKAEDEPEKAAAVNCAGIANISEIASKTGARLIHFSTDYVFPGTKPEGYSEDDETEPSSVYGASKLNGELELRSITPEHFIFRISWLYGLHGKNFVHTMLNLFNERDELNVVNDQFGSPTYSGELADFIVKRIIKSDSEKYGTYHFSGEGMTTWYEFACEIYSIALKQGMVKKPVTINPVDSSQYPTKAKRPAYSYMLKDKLYKNFNFKPSDWRDILENYISLSLSRKDGKVTEI